MNNTTRGEREAVWRIYTMKSIGSISVLPRIPAALERLQELAYNLWWSWNPDARISLRAWTLSCGKP